MNRPICCKYRLLRLCLFLLLMLSLTGCGARREARLRWVTYSETGADRYATRLYQTGSFVNASVASISRDILADPDQWEKVFEEYDTEGIYSKTYGFHYSESRKESIITALQAIFGDYSTELRTGTSDPDVVIPKMRARMEAAGFDKLLADVQDQINEWFASGH